MPALRLEHQNGIAIVTIDLPGEPVNKVTAGLRTEFAELFGRIESDTMVKGIVVMTGKPDTWLAGADIDEFLTLHSVTDAESLSRGGQALLARLESLRVPVVAAIHGACLGGGLETALACHYRIASDHPKTVLALPEVQLGLIPGAGGTQRLPRLIGLQRALDMILTGRNIRAKKALQMGLVDELVHPAILREVAVERASRLADGSLDGRHSPKGRGATGVLLEDNPIGRSIVFKKAREGVMSKTHGHYPAPLAALAAVQAGYDGGVELGYRLESRSFGELAMSDVAKELMFLFFATSALKKDPGIASEAPEPREVETLGVLGAGFMGAGIASVAVQQGTPVRLKDTELARVGKGIAAVSEVLRERLKKKQITRLQYEDQMLLVRGTVDYSGFGRATLVIEAVFEDLALKHRVLQEVEPALRMDAVYASNTSTIPISRIAEAAARPTRVLGMHFFSPVHKMPLLEVITTGETDDDAIVTAVAYGKRIGKTVIVVNDAPGFYTTRILSAYMNEAGRLLDEGASIDAVDAALTDFGFPVGPITLLDEVGIDVGGKVGLVLSEAFGGRMSPSDSLRRVVESGRTGRKGRKGFYLYDESGKKGEVDPSVYEVLPGGAQRRDFPA
ncbi:MAG TPA: 3-hydroxyacyl-CoA dehydrogenase NAD-binding domain-containing protein, partial [Gemmatimonadaceae bacterium]|nr:3-hydroxyacyl-CoA dehydrogenase NAD-binding domain-containing protein [Gemmatimonadaceae bacterium]